MTTELNKTIVSEHIPCPSCPSSDAYCIYADGHGYCFSCQYYNPPTASFDLLDYTYEYLPIRGLTKDTLKHYGIKTKIDHDGKPIAIGFPYPNGSTKIRNFNEKVFKHEGGSSPALFGLDKFAAGADKSITITEGEFDAASIFQATGCPAVSVRSSSSALADVGSVRSELNAYERILLAFDNDARGREATAAVAKLFDPSKVFHVKFTNRKDANEYLQHGEEDILLNLHRNARRWVPDTVVCTFEDFRNILRSSPPQEGVPYPFPTLTRMTYGLRTGEVVLLKAQEKVGKTALTRSILHNLLKRTDDNVATFFLEEPKDRFLKSLAGLELGKPIHLPDHSVSPEVSFGAIEALLRKDERLFVYDNFGVNDPDVLLDTIRFLVVARGVRFVFIDVITVAVLGMGSEADERRLLEYLTARLEMQVKELDYGLFMVSHVNDNGQTRGSHYITKAADITIDASRNTLAEDDRTKRTIQLSIPYNRFSSNTGLAGTIVFDPSTYLLHEEQQQELSHDDAFRHNGELRLSA